MLYLQNVLWRLDHNREKTVDGLM